MFIIYSLVYSSKPCPQAQGRRFAHSIRLSTLLFCWKVPSALLTPKLAPALGQLLAQLTLKDMREAAQRAKKPAAMVSETQCASPATRPTAVAHQARPRRGHTADCSRAQSQNIMCIRVCITIHSRRLLWSKGRCNHYF